MIKYSNLIKYMKNRNIILITALIIRIVFILIGKYIDSNINLSKLSIKYTDIDYNIFTDSSLLLLSNQSPYER
jgi:phosphatidylinositol glycan class M